MLAKITRPDFYSGDRVVTLSATVKSGDTEKKRDFKFLIKRADRTNAQALAEDTAYIKKNIPSIVKENLDVMSELTLPCGTVVEWTSSSDNIIAVNGTVHRPDFGSPSEEITLTAKLSNGTEKATETLTVTVLALSEEDELNVLGKKLTWDLIKKENTDKARIVSDLNLVTKLEGVEDVTVSWQSNDITYVDNTGKVTRPEYDSNDVQITLTATLHKNDNKSTVTFNGLKVLKKSPSAAQRCVEYVQDEDNLLKWITANGTNGNKGTKNIVEGFILPAENDDMLVTWAVVNSSGDPATTNYFKIDYVDDSNKGDIIAEQARRYIATVTRPTTNNVQTYIKVTATISSTSVDGTQVPGGTASHVYPITILQQAEESFARLMAISPDDDFIERKNQFTSMLKSEYGRATWSLSQHTKIKEELSTKTKESQPEIKDPKEGSE